MLHLKMATDPRWVNIAEKSLSEILIDHAFCEQKAATSCISIIVAYSAFPEIVDALTPIVAEEWGHFRRVLKEMKQRNIALGPKRADEYVNKLIDFQVKQGRVIDKLVDKLLLCALIEARSCERFRLLSLHCSDAYFRNFYHEFMVSEAGHYRLFMDLALHYWSKEDVKTRWEAWLAHEAAVLTGLALRGDRIH